LRGSLYEQQTHGCVMNRNVFVGGVSIVIALFLIFQGIASLADNSIRAILMFIAGAFLLLIFNYTRTRIHDIFTSEQFSQVKQWFPDEIKKNRHMNIRWIASSTTIAVLLVVQGSIILHDDMPSASIMLVAGIWLAALSIFLIASMHKVFTVGQILMMKGSANEIAETSRLKALDILQKGAKQGETVSVDSLFANLKSPAYRATKSEEELSAMESLERDFREKYGDFVPVDEAYKITVRVQKGIDPFGSQGD
jgi:hypothetical protein